MTKTRLLRNSLFAFACAATAALTNGSLRAEDDAVEITIEADKLQLIFKTTEFTVPAGKKVLLTLVNPKGSIQPHNLIIVSPGKEQEVGALANLGLTDPEFLKNPVPESDDVLFATELLQPDSETTLEFTAPEEPGQYPYMCTFPGHWMIMKGVMTVE
ncbi:MAG: plastocyanin/azurin family copper-binding protein [Verrucomicrobiota bacterium]